MDYNFIDHFVTNDNNNMAFIATQDGVTQLLVNTNNVPDNRRKLIIHFDIRNTVLVADSVTNVSMEQALNSFLTGVVWGQEHSKGMWVWDSYEPSLKPTSKNSITYYKFLEKILVKTPSDRAHMRIVTGDFTQERIGEAFYPFFISHLTELQWHHQPNSNQNFDKMTMSGKDGKEYHYLLKSVYRVIHHLYQTGRDFAIVFRTYGLDAPNVIDSLAHGLRGNHPDFPGKVPLGVNYTPGLVMRKKGDSLAHGLKGNHPDFPGQVPLGVNCTPGLVMREKGESIIFEVAESNQDDGDVVSKQYEGDREIYEMLNNKQGISGFKDDFIYWQSNGYHHETGKPLYIDPYDEKVQHIFFDDNIRTFENDSIVNVRLFETKGCVHAKSLTKVEAAKFENVCMVQADLLRAIQDEDYFVNAINICEENYAKFVHRYCMDS